MLSRAAAPHHPEARHSQRNRRGGVGVGPGILLSSSTSSCNLLLLLLLLAAAGTMPTSSALSSPSRRPPPPPARFVGFDLGTSGARMSVIERDSESSSSSSSSYREIHSDAILWSTESDGRKAGGGNGDGDARVGGAYDDAAAWVDAVRTLLDRAASSSSVSSTSGDGDDGTGANLLSSVKSICVSGTSASCLLADSQDAGKVTRPARMYDYDVVARSSSDDPAYAIQAMELLEKYAPPNHTARARTGALAKLLAWHAESPLASGEVLCHQADYVALQLMSEPKKCGAGAAENTRRPASDWHNCLKLGYDVRNLCWPAWLVTCLEEGAGIRDALKVLPNPVVSPGAPLGTISSTTAARYGLGEDVVVVGGTTDSNAAFFAAAGSSPSMGTAVTSLGSTLAMKQLSSQFVEDADRGVYSHRFPVFAGKGKDNDGDDSKGGDDAGDEDNEEEAWLIGGASNVGCAVLRQQHFSTDELIELSANIDPSTDSPLSYYPLTKKGERFPTADPDRLPLLEPIPESRADYLKGILQGIGDVEREGFRVLGELGAEPAMPTEVLSCGGGARNGVWREMRRRRLAEICVEGEKGGPEVKLAENTEASYGAAVLAAATFD